MLPGQAPALLQSVEKRFCRFQVSRVEVFGEAIVDGLEQRRRLGVPSLITQQPGQPGRRSQERAP